MLARVITLRFDTALGGFDDEPLRDFLKDKQVSSIREHFFIADDTPYLAVMVTYYLPPPLSPAVSTSGRKQENGDWRDWVPEADRPLFDALRDWRSKRCQQLGIPPYVVATNRQLAMMVQMRPQSLAQLGTIERFGKSRVAKYGHDILAILAKAPLSEATDQEKAEDAVPNHGNTSQST